MCKASFLPPVFRIRIGSGFVSGSTDPDPGRAKITHKVTKVGKNSEISSLKVLDVLF
jgi:hypothetical protein